MFIERVAADPGRPALHAKVRGQYRAVSWSELDAHVRLAAMRLVALGLRPGDRVLQVSENRYEWIVCDLAIQMAGGIHVPVHAALTGEQLTDHIVHSGACLVLLSRADQAAKLVRCADRLPADLRCFSFDPCPDPIGDRPVGRWADQSPGVFRPTEADPVLNARLAGLTPDSLATILYTSGTLGEPKGVMLTQGNLAFNAVAAAQATGETAADLKLCFLPLSHIFARTCDVYKWIACGSQLALAESRETVLADAASLAPTWINGVPYFFERVRRELCRRHGEHPPHGLRSLLGGRIQTCHVGGAPVSEELYDFYWSRGVPLFTGYGLTESSPVIAVSNPQHAKCQAVGKPLRGTDVRIAPDGEILTRGPHVMVGYWQDPVATAAALRDGWLHTGDLGRFDEDGLLCLTGRKKEMLVTTGGKKIAPAYLEALLMEDPLIEQALVVGDGRDYLVALIVPNPSALAAELAERAGPVDRPALRTAESGSAGAETRGACLTDPSVHALYEARLRQRLARVSHYEQIGRFALLERAFSIERGELTPKQSLRRTVIAEHFAAEIERLYEQQDHQT